MARSKKPHTRQCNAYEAAVMRRRRGKSLPDDGDVIALGRQCSNSQHRGTRRQSTPQEAAMSVPVASAAPKSPKAKAPTRKGVDKPAPAAPADGPSPIGRALVAAGLMTVAVFAARANYTMLLDTFHSMGSKYPDARAMGVVAPEFVAGWAVLEALGWSNWWHLRHRLTMAQARWFAGVAVIAFASVVGWEVSLAWDRSSFALADIAFKWAMTRDPGDTNDTSPVPKDAATLDLVQQALAGFVLPSVSLLSTLGAEMLDDAFRSMFTRRAPEPKRAPAPSPSPRTEEEPLGDKVARFPLGASTRT